MSENIEAAVRRCSVKKVFSEILQNSQEICKISKNTFSYRTPLVPTSKNTYNKCGAGLQSGTISLVASFFTIFFIHWKNYFQKYLRKFVIHFFTEMCQARIYSLFLCFKKSDALYLFSTNWLLLLIIDKFTITEFAILIRNLSFLVPPSTLGEHIYGVSVILRKGIFQISPGWLPPLLLF